MLCASIIFVIQFDTSIMSLSKQQKIIVITGVESTGKTTLAKSLASELEQAYIPEYARQYLEKRGGEYKFEDLEEIARLQLSAIENTSSEYIIVDTALIVLKIWSEEKYGKCSRYILNELANFEPTAYLLCDIDIAWEADDLREYRNQNDRIRLHKNYLSHLQEQSSPLLVLSGTKKERLKKAAQFIKSL